MFTVSSILIVIVPFSVFIFLLHYLFTVFHKFLPELIFLSILLCFIRVTSISWVSLLGSLLIPKNFER